MKLNVLDLFCGCGGMAKGFVDAGLNIVAGIDIWDVAVASYNKNFKHKAYCQDLTLLSPEKFNELYNKKNKPIDVLIGGPPCFIAGTKVLTDSKYKNIEDVLLEDKLLTHTGKYQKIVNLQTKIYSGDLYELNIKYHPEIITCTEEHPFFVREKKILNGKIYFDEPVWKNAKDLTLNDYFGMVIDDLNHGWIHNSASIYKYVNSYVKSHGNIDKNGKIHILTDSYNLAYKLQHLYLKLGYIYGIKRKNNTYVVAEYLNNKKRLSFIENNYVWYEPVEINKKHAVNTPVYNFEVENDNSYVVNNVICHNCQSYSIAGKRDKNDPRNTLFMEYVKYLNYYKPKAFIMENVIGLLSKKTESGENVIDIIMNHLNTDYNCIINKLYASDFEVPQNRRRTIIIGLRKNLNIIPTKPDLIIKDIGNRIPVKNILIPRENIDKKYYLTQKALNGIENKKKASKNKGCGFGAQFLNPDKPSFTIPARYWKDGYDALVKYNETDIRRLTIVELKRIQTFPDDYIIEGSNKNIIMQIGNAVPCKFAYHLARYIINILQ